MRFVRLLPCVLLLPSLISCASNSRAEETETWDVVVYGGTSAGVIAALEAKRLHKSVVVLEPSRHLGGLSSGGLGATDIGNKKAIGGQAREFYRRVARHYAKDESWKVERREDYRSSRLVAGEETMWTFEPRVAEKIFDDLAHEHGVPVERGARLRLDRNVVKRDGRIVEIELIDGRKFAGRFFIDATYEGDLLARAGVSYPVGRESHVTYDETLNGVQTANARFHQFRHAVDPYVTPGDPTSGLLPEIHPEPPGPDGSGDGGIQAYCFRMCLTDAPENRRAIEKPPGYDVQRYELLLRYFEAGFDREPWHIIRMPNRKSDINNNHGFSTDWIGGNVGYVEADYDERERIIAAHRDYQVGLIWCLQNEPRVPEKIRESMSQWGLPKDEFGDTGGWPHHLYIREARRMIGEYVMTQAECEGRRVAPDPIGLAAYTMDSHNVWRYVKDGRVWNEGDVQVGGFPPYPIALGAILPKREECVNLAVPVCVSSSHIAFGSIRMEPVFMVLGQSAAHVAAAAIDETCAAQDIDRESLIRRLRKVGQVLEWKATPPSGALDTEKLAGLVVDDRQATFTGTWTHSRSTPWFVGLGYRHDGADRKGSSTARFPIRVSESGEYELRYAYSAHANRAPSLTIRVSDARGTRSVAVDLRKTPPLDRAFVSLGAFHFESGKPGAVEVSNANTEGYVIVDAIQVVPGAKDR